MKNRTWLAAGVLLFVGNAAAHPGHGAFEHGTSHLVFDPYHLFTGLAFSALLWAVSRIQARPLARKCAQGAAAVVAVLAFGSAFLN